MRSLPLVLLALAECRGYSVLTHEAIIDSAWESNLRPMLVKRFPDATPEEIKKAHAYLYGGALVQDMGYVPLSSKEFSNLAHYVRAGDFVTTLLEQATALNDYAFALGTLAHYASDSGGHPTINRITPLIYPKLRRKFGDVVTYEDDPAGHLKTEFALDVIQVSRGLYAPDAYHDFIGFEVAQAALERAFETTYGIPMKDLFKSEDLAIGTYRFAVGKLIPEMSKVAWSSKRKDIEKLSPGIVRSRFVYAFPRAQYRKEWDSKYRTPGKGARFLAFLFRLIPAFGPFKALGFQPVPPRGERMFLRSFDETVERYKKLLGQAASGTLRLSEVNLDTGAQSRPGAYKLADSTYFFLVDRLARDHFQNVSPGLKADIIRYFAGRGGARIPARTQMQLQQLENAPSRADSG